MKNANGPSRDDALLEQLTQVVLDNLENEQFGVEYLSEQVGMSRSHLHRKLKLLKGKSVSRFIREVRLEEAMKLLQNDVATASEIAYRVGFGSTSYFNACFHAHYGFPPGEVKKGDNNAALQAASIEEEKPPVKKNPTSKRLVTPNKAMVLRQKALLTVPLFLLAVLVSIYILYSYRPKPEFIFPKGIAVLPLDNKSGDVGQEYLAAGMHEALIGELGKISGLRVIANKPTLHYSGHSIPIQEIARQLGVNLFIEGSVLASGDSVRIQVKLMEAFPKERQLRSMEYCQPIGNAFEMYKDAVNDIVQEVQVNLTPEEKRRLATVRTVNPESYKDYLRGIYFLNKSTPEDFRKGLDYLHQAIDIDPADPLAWAQLSIGYAILGHGPTPSQSIWKRGKAAALRAIDLDSTLAEAHMALGFIKLYLDWDWAGAEQSFIRANELKPNLAIIHFNYAWFLVIFGRMDKALAEHKLAVELDPLTPIFTADMGSLYHYLGRYDEAIVELKKALELDKDFGHAWWALGRVYAQKGWYDQAIAAHKKAVEINPIWNWALATTYAMAGQQDKALDIVAGLKAGNINSRTAFGLARIYVSLGDMDEAFRWLNHEPPDTWLPWVRTWPEFDPLKDDPRFGELLKRMGLPPL